MDDNEGENISYRNVKIACLIRTIRGQYVDPEIKLKVGPILLHMCIVFEII